MLNILNFFATVAGPYTMRQLVVAHAGSCRTGGRNYRTIRSLIENGTLFQIGDNFYINGIK